MVPAIVDVRLKHAEAVAAGLREKATEILRAAQTIDELVNLVKLANWQAKLNHDTITDMAARRAL